MMEDGGANRKLALSIVEKATPSEREMLKAWAREMLEIRALPISGAAKARRAWRATLTRKSVIPALKMAARALKRVIWDERSRAAKFGLGGAATGLALFGGQAAGVAALGVAVGVPLWIVLGAGAAFASVLIEVIETLPRQKK